MSRGTEGQKPSKDLVKRKIRSEKGMFTWKQFSPWGWWYSLNFSREEKKSSFIKDSSILTLFSMTAPRESLGRSDLLQWDVPTLVNMANFRALLAFISIHHESSTDYPLETNVLDTVCQTPDDGNLWETTGSMLEANRPECWKDLWPFFHSRA